MASVGLDIDARRLDSLRASRRLLPAIFLVNDVAVPLVALAAAALLPVDPQVRAGVLLCALAPGGASATLIAARMRAYTAVAAAVVIASTATSVVLTPLLVAAVLGPLIADVAALPLAPVVVELVHGVSPDEN